ncbi:hypothetical protein [Corallococcus macrosporus]|uniref:hypothetical protein n=1 Tax=Corallococcus macrosporus TaxID=35 RepID=UPI00195AF8A2|nr:hypothetical protein [Corallococcus macrosporus]
MKTRSRIPFASGLIASVMLACGLLPRAAAAQSSRADLQEAVAQLALFQEEVRNLRAVIQKPLGPYTVSSTCSWCSSEFLGICFERTTQRWEHRVDFSGPRGQLDHVVAQAEQGARSLAGAYAPTQAWIDGLPAFSAEFAATADRVLAVQQAIKQGQGPTDAQRQEVKQALQKLSDGLTRSAEQLQAGTRALSVSLQQQSTYRDTIQQAIAGTDASVEAAIAKLNQAASVQRCQDGVFAQFLRMRFDFTRSTQEIKAAFQRMEASSRSAEQGLAKLLGTVINSGTDLKSVLDLVQAARDDQLGGFLEQLHLSAARQLWESLAAAHAQARARTPTAVR